MEPGTFQGVFPWQTIKSGGDLIPEMSSVQQGATRDLILEISSVQAGALPTIILVFGVFLVIGDLVAGRRQHLQ
jgi:hypothetical protein